MGSLDTGREPVIATAPEASEAKTANAQRHERPRRRFRRRVSGCPVGQPDSERATTCRDRYTTRVG